MSHIPQWLSNIQANLPSSSQPPVDNSIINKELNKQCVVPKCLNNSELTPQKLFISVPQDRKIRVKWLDSAKLYDLKLLEVNPIYFCEDHFKLREDMENYKHYRATGDVNSVTMKPSCFPKKFRCLSHLSKRKKRNQQICLRNLDIFINRPIMENDESSNDVEAVETVQYVSNFVDKEEERPIMLLFDRLIGNDNKQNTVLTNDQIKQILLKEFGIDIEELNELELDIYLTVTKKFLKDWPQWDDFDRIVNGLKKNGAYDSIKKILDKKYKHLKEYLQVMLKETKKQADVVMSEISKEEKDENDEDDIVMEISCTRTQLNQLIFRRPHPDLNNTIFNVVNPSPSRIVLNAYSIETILNWWSIRININLFALNFRRETVHITEHMLVNKVRKTKRSTEEKLPQHLLMKPAKKPSVCKVSKIIELLDMILSQYTNNIEVHYLIDTVFDMIKDDLKDAPSELCPGATYRRFSSKNKYRRYLNADSFCKSSDMAKYDLQLEETISPMYEFCVSKLDTLNSLLPSFSEWFSITCVLCNEKFSGVKLLDGLKVHFSLHMGEPDWRCVNCNTLFTMTHLAERKWSHVCSK